MGENLDKTVNEIDSVVLSAIDRQNETSTANSTGKTLKRPLTKTDGTSNTPNERKKQRLDVVPKSIKTMYKNPTKNATFIYGNYDRYYGYRNANDYQDIRLNAFEKHRSYFEGCNVLDIGCNNGLVTISVARNFNVKHIVGIDIDRHLIEKARKFLSDEKRSSNASEGSFPLNLEFKTGNYVLVDEKLLELETEQFDTILCLSVTKWIHLNCGDVGLKLSFRRMYKQLVPGGRLILEAQDWKNYKRRKNLTPKIANNYKSITFFPEMFDKYLLGSEVGFQSCFSIEVPKDGPKGFQRPIKVIHFYFLLVCDVQENSVQL